jgi:hypothetical protein
MVEGGHALLVDLENACSPLPTTGLIAHRKALEAAGIRFRGRAENRATSGCRA